MTRPRIAAAGLLVLAFLVIPDLLPAPPNPISSLSLSPTSVLGGSPSTGTVTLTKAAPTGGAVVSLTSSNTAAATVPSSVTVPAGLKTTTFSATTYAVGASTSVTISASYSGGTKPATLTVASAVLTSVNVSPTNVYGGTPSTGTVSLNGPAPATGALVTLSSSNPAAAAVPGSATIPSGANSATFGVTTSAVTSSTPVTITAAYNGTSRPTTLTVTPAPVLSSLTLNSTSALAGSVITGTATLSSPAPSGGAVVTLWSSDTSAATAPASVTIAAGSTFNTFNVTTLSVPADTAVTISGSYGGVSKSASLTVASALTFMLDNGSGPIYTIYTTVGVRGHVSPASAGPGTSVTGTLGSQTVNATAAADGAFTLPTLNLAVGSNSITVTATHSGSGQSAGPAAATYIRDNQSPTATVGLLTQIPDPTNQANWTLTGTVSGYQGPVENAYITMSNGSQLAIAQEGTWSVPHTFAEGDSSINLMVKDLAGNTGPQTSIRTHLDSQGIRAVPFLDTILDPAADPNSWPNTLDNLISSQIYLNLETTWTLKGSHVEVFLDEPGLSAGSPPPACGYDDLSCVVARNAVPDVTRDFLDDGNRYMSLPKLPAGLHNLRVTVRDPFGVTTERGGVIVIGWGLDQVPVANFAVPGTITNRVPKIAGRTMSVNVPIDCDDKAPPEQPLISYWDPAQSGSWKPLPVRTFSNPDGTYEITPEPGQLPQGGIPVTTNSGGQQVLRLSLRQTNGTAGRVICSPCAGAVCDGMQRTYRHVGGNRLVDEGILDYDLPYRAPSQSDSPAPTIDMSAVQDVATQTEDPYTHSIRLRVTDLNGDLDYRNVTIATLGCSSPDCTYRASLAGDQMLTTTQPGGYFTAKVPLAVGTNELTATATDDAGHVTNQTFTIQRVLTAVVAKITSPASEGTLYRFCPGTITLDASNSINRTDPPEPLRYQWTKLANGFWQSVNDLPTYSENVQFSDDRRVVVSSSAIPTPNATSSTPCADAPAGLCSVAVIYLRPYSVLPPNTLGPQINSPLANASVRIDLPVTLSGTAFNDTDPSYVYWWQLIRSGVGNVPIPQATGTGSDPRYAFSNRVLTLRLDSVPGVTVGDYTLFFHAARQTAVGDCSAQQSYKAITIHVTGKQYSATGLSPGAVVVGDGSTRLYGSGFDAAAQIAISGPIYALGNITTPLCTMPACPQVAVLATVGANGTTLDFTVPVSLAPGYYQVFAADPATGAASSPVWLEAQPLQGTAPAKTQAFSGIISPIVDGQTLNGQFLAGRDPSGQFSDVDYYYFFATAGSSLDLSLTRSDTSLPWEAPDALDPQLVVVDPDGLVWQGFESLDNQAGVDLNASLDDLVLPKTGRYKVDAANSKGFGPYQLAFSLTPAPPPSALQILPATNNDRTVPLNTAGLKPMAFTFDPRGYPLSGAVAQFVSVAEANETGQISFPGGSSIATSTRGFAQVDATLVAAGKVSFEARLLDTSLVVPQGKVVQPASAPLPTYRPLGIVSHHEQGIDPLTGASTASFDRIERLEQAPPDLPVVAFRTGKDGKRIREDRPAGNPSHSGHARMLKDAGPLSMDVITSCSPGQFRAAGVNASSVQGPFTVTLKDLTPKTGEPSTPPAEEVIGVTGINSHRVDKTIRIRFEIKDAAGAEPTYPVLVRLSLVGGTPSGTLILDPDGARTPCQSASFLWHERDAQGQIIALNEEFEYQLTKRSVFVGVKPDPENPGEVLPVWGTTEFLSASFGTFDAQDGTLTNQFSANYSVHPEPGTPDHFKWNPTLLPPPHRLEYLVAYVADFGLESETFTNGLGYANLYYLADVFDNSTYGHTATSATSPAPNIQVAFAAQQVSDDPTEGSSAYRLTINWNDNPTGANPKPSSQWPNGEFVTTLTVTGTDVETGPFSVSQNFTAAFSQLEFHSLVWVDAYDPPGGNGIDLKFDFSVNPPVPITFVSPGAARTFLNGDLSRNSIVLVRGTRLSWTSVTPIGWIGPPGSDPELVTDGLDSFDVSLVDDDGNLVTDSEIQVAFCLNYEVERDGPCPTGNRTSSGGVILGVRPTDRGYMGLMVTKAPAAPGVYFFRIRPVPSNVHEWRVGGSLDSSNNYTYTYAVTVLDGEILDANFQRKDPLVVEQPTQAYARLVDPSATADTVTIMLTTYDSEGQPVVSDVPVTLTRTGESSTFLAPVIFTPQGYYDGQSKGFRPSASLNGPELFTEYVTGVVEAQKSGLRAMRNNTATAAELRVVWLDENGNPVPDQPPGTARQVTRIRKTPDPTGTTPFLYVEETRLRLRATDAQGRLKSKAKGRVRLDEALNPAFPENQQKWQLSYKKEFEVATDLQDTRSVASLYTSINLVGGITTEIVSLKSLAGPRKTSASPLYSREWDALLRACDAKQALPCTNDATSSTDRFKRGDFAVGQWVDHQTYERHTPGSAFNRQDGPNGVRDWLDALGWETLADLAGKGGVLSAVGGCPSDISEEAGSVPIAFWAGSTITFGAQAITDDRIRWNQGFCSFHGEGLRTTYPRLITSLITAHEARHCWQFKMVQENPADQDPDIDLSPSDPEALDPSALRLKDSGHIWVGGNNPEVHFAGPASHDQFALWHPQQERDAAFFERAAAASLDSLAALDIQAAVTNVALVAPAGDPPRVFLNADGVVAVDAIRVSVSSMSNQQNAGRCEDASATMYAAEARMVELTVSSGPGPGLAVLPKNTATGSCNASRCLALTDNLGQASFDLSASQAGTYTINLFVPELIPDGLTANTTGWTRTIEVTVTP